MFCLAAAASDTGKNTTRGSFMRYCIYSEMDLLPWLESGLKMLGGCQLWMTWLLMLRRKRRDEIQG